MGITVRSSSFHLPARGKYRQGPYPVTTGVDTSVDGRDRAAEMGDDLAQAVAVLDVRDHGQAGRWNKEDLIPGFR